MSSAEETTRLAEDLHSFAVRLLRRARAADRASGLSPERLSVLSVLVFAGPQTVSTLAALESVSPPAISRIARALARAGHVARRRDDQDRRTVFLSATSKGRRLVLEGRARRVAVVAEGLASLSPAERDTLERARAALKTLIAQGLQDT